MISLDVHNAFIADLKEIKTANGYNTNVDNVFGGRSSATRLAAPSIELLDIRGTFSELDTIGNLEAYFEQEYEIRLRVQGADALDDALKFVDDVRNATERSDGNLGLLAGVIQVDLTEWNRVGDPEDLKQSREVINASVRVRYDYRRSAA